MSFAQQRRASSLSQSRFLVTAPEGEPVNDSGLRPIGTKVLLLADVVANQSQGGVFMTDRDLEIQTNAVVTGTLVAVGGAAFTDWPHVVQPWPGAVPVVGDRVVHAFSAGVFHTGQDGRRYRLMEDKDLMGFGGE